MGSALSAMVAGIPVMKGTRALRVHAHLTNPTAPEQLSHEG